MDILKPPTVWINGLCYRKAFTNDTELDQQGNLGEYREHDEYDDNFGAENDVDFSAEMNPELEAKIRTLENGKVRLKFHVASPFFPIIIGKKGMTKKRIEAETKTKIDIPRQGQEGDITLTGVSKGHLIAAYNRIQVMVETSRSKHEFTHFLSIPVNQSIIKDSFARFKSEVLNELSDERGIEESVFQNPGLIHLTIGIMVLLDGEERIKAAEVLQDCKERVLLQHLGDNLIQVHVKGLEIMNDDPSEVGVVYAKVESCQGPDLLQKICDSILDEFTQANLADKQHDKVKVHVTLMNTLFSVKEENEERKSLDGRKLLEKFGDFDFGKVELDEIHLSQRKSGKRTESGYYWPTAVCKLGNCG